METGRCPHHWLSDFVCRYDTPNCYIVTTMLAPSGDRAVPALFDLLCGHHDACSKWRQGGARITVLSDVCTMTLLVMGAVG